MYYFLHDAEKRSTKQYRTGVTRDVSSYGLEVEALIVDPSILPEALRGDLLFNVRLVKPEVYNLRATCRVVWVRKVEGDSANLFRLGLEYTDANEDGRLALLAYAEEHGTRLLT